MMKQVTIRTRNVHNEMIGLFVCWVNRETANTEGHVEVNTS